MKSAVLVVLPFTFWLSATSGLLAANETSPRQVVALDGVWSVAEGRLEEVPASFDRAVPVPGLVTLATPAFTPEPGPKVADRLA